VAASVASCELRDQATSNLLFWSSYDFAVDAATQQIGPLDFLLRGGADWPIEDLYTIEESYEPEAQNRTAYVKPERPTSDKENLRFSLFQEGDGSETDPDGIPLRYLTMQRNHRHAALKALDATLHWRKENKIDEILAKPHPKFDLCKQVFPHYFLGRDKENHVVFLQRPALIDLKKAHANGLTKDELLMHYVYVNEYLWQILEADNPLGTMTSVLDLTGLDLGVLKQRELIGFVKKFVSTMDAHFPTRANKTLILNAPKWFNMLYKMFSPLLREATKAKITILSRGKKQDEVVRRELGDSISNLLPPSFWSKNDKKKKKRKRGKHHHHEDDEDESHNAEVEPIPESDLEKQLRSFTLSRLKEKNIKMQVVA
jgi:hypothetical protein